MSVEINLLPWREARRQRRTRRYYGLLTLFTLLGVAIGGALYVGVQHRLEAQQLRNALITEKTAALDAEMAQVSEFQQEVERLEEQVAALVSLQARRNHTVALFNNMAEGTVRGVVLKRLSRDASLIRLEALASSERQVSEQLRRIEQQPGLGVPRLLEVAADSDGRKRRFRLEVAQGALSQLSPIDEVDEAADED